VNSSLLLCLLLLACLIGSTAASHFEDLSENKAKIWFQKEYGSYLTPKVSDKTPPVIYSVSVSPSVLKIGDPRSEINAFVYDPSGIETVYADIGNRMNLMLDLDQDHRYTGYCGSNLAPGTYNVTIVAIDKFGNAARDETGSITIRDPRDLDGDGIDDSLKAQGTKDQRVIVLHDGNLSNVPAARGQESFKILPVSAMTIPGNELKNVAKIKGVKGIYKDQKLKVLAYPGRDPAPGKKAASLIDDPRKDRGLNGDGVTVALIDTGADPEHEALAGKIVEFKDFVNNQTTAYDDNGHGTHCASLIAGGGEERGVAPGAKLVVVKVMDKDGACYLSDALKALDWCLENKDRYGIKVISFSVGGEDPADGSSLLDEACDRMVDKGLVMVVAAGNSGPAPSSIVTPGDAEKVITVGAIDSSGTVFNLSSRGPVANGEVKPDLVTLGVDVVSALAYSKDKYSSMSGTSMAVPQVSGASALLLQADPALKPSDVKRLLLKTADDLNQPIPDNVYGYGALNLTRALDDVESSGHGPPAPALDSVHLNRLNAYVGDPIMIEAGASGDIKAMNANIIGPDRTLQIPMDDFDANGIYSARWETSFWKPGDYEVNVDMEGQFGEVDSKAVPFHLSEKA